MASGFWFILFMIAAVVVYYQDKYIRRQDHRVRNAEQACKFHERAIAIWRERAVGLGWKESTRDI